MTSKSIEQSIEIEVPASTAYNAWTQFEMFPLFMQGIRKVEQTDDRHLHWEASIAGKAEQWEAEITEQIPDKRIAWRSTQGATHAGVVTFHRLADTRCRLMLQLDYAPESIVERVGDAFGVVPHRVAADLRRFKEFAESAGDRLDPLARRDSVPAKPDAGKLATEF